MRDAPPLNMSVTLYGEADEAEGYTLSRITADNFPQWQGRFLDGTTRRLLAYQNRLSGSNLWEGSGRLDRFSF